jgi:hypothetical protein
MHLLCKVAFIYLKLAAEFFCSIVLTFLLTRAVRDALVVLAAPYLQYSKADVCILYQVQLTSTTTIH